MCFDLDSRPPIAPIAGGALDSSELTLEAEDGNLFRAFRARASGGGSATGGTGTSGRGASGAGIVILPDVRGLHPFFEELALRFAENGVDAIAIDYFGRTAGVGSRSEGFDPSPHAQALTWAGVSADIGAATRHLRVDDERRVDALFTIGFCLGGRLAFLTSTLGLDLAGAIGFYGIPVGPSRGDIPAPIDLAGSMANPILALFGGADSAISPDAISRFDAALAGGAVDHRFVTYDGAPHSFFDRKADAFADASSAAWDETLTFVRGHTPSRERGD